MKFLVMSLVIGALGVGASMKEHVPKAPRFISFDAEGGQIDIDLDLSVPFLSIPLDNQKSADGGPPSLLNVNTKAITAAGLMAAIAVFLVPLFFKSTPGHNYRLDDDFGLEQISKSVHDLILGNNHVTPCIQLAVCSLIDEIVRTDNPTSVEKIIDGVSSNKWFESLINGTAIEEAIAAGRQGNRECSFIYKGCSISEKMFDTIVQQFRNF